MTLSRVIDKIWSGKLWDFHGGIHPEEHKLESSEVPLVEAAFAEPNPAAIKAWLAQEGRMANELRAPMSAASPALAQRLARLRLAG